jgi:hypothetical protein
MSIVEESKKYQSAKIKKQKQKQGIVRRLLPSVLVNRRIIPPRGVSTVQMRA